MSATTVIIWLALAFAAFTKVFLAPGVTLFDAAFGAAVAIATACLIVRRGQPPLPSWSTYVWALILWSGVVGVAMLLFDQLSTVEFLKSWSKLIYYGVGSVVLCSYFNGSEPWRVRNAILAVLTFHASIAIYIYIAQSTGSILPYEFLWIGQDNPVTRSLFRNVSVTRARGLFSEPSILGIFQTVGLALLLLAPGAWRPPRWKLGLVLCSVLLTFSLSSLALICILIAIYAIRPGRTLRLAPRRTIYIVLVPLGLVAIAAAAPVTRRALNETVVARVGEVLSGADLSAMGRLIGSYETVDLIVEESPVVGSGLGGLGKRLRDNESQLTFARMLIRGDAEAWNLLAYVFGNLGIVGLILFLLLLGRLWRISSATGVLFVSMFATGGFLTPLFWVHICLIGSYALGHAPEDRHSESAIAVLQ